MKKLLPLLCLALIVVLSSCTKAQRIRGTWECPVNKEKIANMLGADEDDIDDVKGKEVMTFAKDGTCERKFDVTVKGGGEKLKISMTVKTNYKVDDDKITFSNSSIKKFKIDDNDILEGMTKKERKKAEEEIDESYYKIKKLTSKKLEVEDEDGESYLFTKQ